MSKSNVKLSRKYKESYEVLKNKYEDACQKNIKLVKINNLYGIVERKWKGENSYLQQENSLEVSKVMKLRTILKDKNYEITNLKKEIENLKEQL